MKKVNSIIRYVLFLSCLLSVTMSFTVIFSKPALGMEWLETSRPTSGNTDYLWLGSDGKPMGILRRIKSYSWQDGAYYRYTYKAAYYMYGLNNNSPAIVITDYDPPKKPSEIQHIASMTEDEMDDLSVLYEKALAFLKKIKENNLDIEKTVLFGEIDGKWEEVKVVLEKPEKPGGEIPVLVYFKNKINESKIRLMIPEPLDHYNPEKWLFLPIPVFQDIRNKVKNSWPRIEQFLQERESLKQQLQQ